MSIEKNNVLILNTIKDHYKFRSDAEFARFLSIKPTTLSSWYSRNTFDYDLVYAKCVDISGEFLLSGKGEKMRGKQLNNLSVSVVGKAKSRLKLAQTVPLYDIRATAGIVELMSSSENGKHIPIDYISIPNLPKCDGALPITGDSMYPLLKSGDIALYKEVTDYSNILWGEMYLIAIIHNGDEFFFAKYLQRSENEGWVKLVSQNQHHQDKEFPMESIKALALIKASIRINAAF